LSVGVSAQGSGGLDCAGCGGVAERGGPGAGCFAAFGRGPTGFASGAAADGFPQPESSAVRTLSNATIAL